MNELRLLTSTRGLTDLGVRRPEAPKLLTKIFKKGERKYGTKEIRINTKNLGMYMLPTVSDKSGGTLLEGAERDIVLVPTPRLKPVFSADADEILFTVGDNGQPELGAGRSHATEREREIFNDGVDTINNSFGLSEELYLSQLLTTGKVTSKTFGDNKRVYDFEVDFHFPNGHIITLTDEELWTANGVNPFKQERRFADLIRSKTGMTVDVAIHGNDSWEGFSENKIVKDRLNNRAIDAGSATDSAIKEYVGKINGLKRYVYGGSYPDVFGGMHEVFESDCTLYGCTMAPTIMHYGMPRNALNKKPTKRLFSSKLKEEGLILKAESCPLPATDMRCFVMVRKVVR